MALSKSPLFCPLTGSRKERCLLISLVISVGAWAFLLVQVLGLRNDVFPSRRKELSDLKRDYSLGSLQGNELQ